MIKAYIDTLALDGIVVDKVKTMLPVEVIPGVTFEAGDSPFTEFYYQDALVARANICQGN